MSLPPSAGGPGTPAPLLALPPGPLPDKDAAALVKAVNTALAGFRHFDEDAADEAFQEACLAALLERRRLGLPEGRTIGLAVGVARCRRAEFFRRRDRRGKATGRVDDLPARAEEEDEGASPAAVAVGRVLSLLSEKERVVVLGVWANGATQTALAKGLGLSRGQVQRTLRAARVPMLRAAQAAAENS